MDDSQNDGAESVREEEVSREEANRLIEGTDYYLESGFMVFTSNFLARRGYCCESGCRHCPYGYRREEK